MPFLYLLQCAAGVANRFFFSVGVHCGVCLVLLPSANTLIKSNKPASRQESNNIANKLRCTAPISHPLDRARAAGGGVAECYYVTVT